MSQPIFCTIGVSPALKYAAQNLERAGWLPTSAAENASYLLLPVPTFNPDGRIKGNIPVEEITCKLGANTVIIGGNLRNTPLQSLPCIDLLEDERYLSANADITAYCAVTVAADATPYIIRRLPVQVVGWGRIGKCLAQLLKQMGARVTVSARKESDLAMLQALGYDATTTGAPISADIKILFNTVPAMVVTSGSCPPDTVKIDLASKSGIEGSNVIQAKGLPGRLAPAASGALIADSILRIVMNMEDQK